MTTTRLPWSKARAAGRAARRSAPALQPNLPSLWDRGYRLCFAEIEVADADQPDSARLLLWQDIDLAPDFPNLVAFLDDWRSRHPGTISSVKVATFDDVMPDMLELRGRSLAIH
jgi:uncharacterized protein Usg